MTDHAPASGASHGSIRQRLTTISLFVLLSGAAFVGLLCVHLSTSRAAPQVVSTTALADGQGIAKFAQAELNAGMTETFCLVFTATGQIAAGGGVRVIEPDFHGTGWAMWQEFQAVSSSQAGYLDATWSEPTADLDVVHQGGSNPQYQSYTTILVTAGELGAGDTVTLCFRQGRIPHKAYPSVPWRTLTDSDGDGLFADISPTPRLRILPKTVPELMVATLPTIIEKGVPATLTVRVLDEYSNPVKTFSDTLTITATNAIVPGPVPFPAGDGVQRYAVTLNTAGIQYVHVNPAGSLPPIMSNPVVVVDSLSEREQIYWGDLHGHHGHVYTSTAGRRVTRTS
jgi:hypothetical protein